LPAAFSAAGTVGTAAGATVPTAGRRAVVNDPAKENIMGTRNSKTEAATLPRSQGQANPGNPGSPRNTIETLITNCAENAVKAGGTPHEVATHAAACALSRIIELAVQPPSNNPGPGTANPNPGSGSSAPPPDK
jgi:hypothetical protein